MGKVVNKEKLKLEGLKKYFERKTPTANIQQASDDKDAKMVNEGNAKVNNKKDKTSVNEVCFNHLHVDPINIWGKNVSTVCGPRIRGKNTDKHCTLYRSPHTTLRFSIANAAYPNAKNIW